MKAFDEVYLLYANEIFKYLMCLTGDRDLAEELTQETFYRAYRNIDKFEGKCKLSVWLCQIAKNSYCTYCKKEKLRRSGSLDEDIISEAEELPYLSITVLYIDLEPSGFYNRAGDKFQNFIM